MFVALFFLCILQSTLFWWSNRKQIKLERQVIGVLLIVMGAMKNLELSGSSDDWSFAVAFNSEGQGVLALTIGVCVTCCTLCLCCVPVCCAECASPEMQHAFGQEWAKCERCCATKCCCCCHCCNHCCDYCCEVYCCRRRRRSDPPNTEYMPRTDPHAIPEVPEMVEMGRPIEMKATAIWRQSRQVKTGHKVSRSRTVVANRCFAWKRHWGRNTLH